MIYYNQEYSILRKNSFGEKGSLTNLFIVFHDKPSVFHVTLVKMGSNRPFFPLSCRLKEPSGRFARIRGWLWFLPALSYRQAKTARVQATYSIPFHCWPPPLLEFSFTRKSESPTEYALRTVYACVQSSLKVREKVRIYHYSTQNEDLTI